jgi:GDP-D-glucose phosphorylase
VAFNSLCAHASVNHLHLHLYYLKKPFQAPTEAVKGSKLTASGLYELFDYPAKGFAFQLTSTDNMAIVAAQVFKA